MGRRRMPVEQRFRYTVTASGCHEWIGTRIGGYGYLSVNGKRVRAHRLAYRVFKGVIPDGLFVLHTCDNPPCVNPDHLYLGTPGDNTQDAYARARLGRSNGGRPEFRTF